MEKFTCINPDQALRLIESGAHTADIRDQSSYISRHISGSQHLSNDNISSFLAETDKDIPLIICCYHGISSQATARYLSQHGFSNVYSLNGGFELWEQTYPNHVEIRASEQN